MSKKKGWMLPAALGALVLVLILVFCIPVRQPKFFEGAQQMHLSMSEMFVTDAKPDSATAVAELEAGDPAIEELKTIFRDYKLYRTFKYFDTLDGATTYSGDNAMSTVSVAFVTEEKDFHNLSLHGKYLHFDNHLWRIGRNQSDWDELAQRLKDFILEHSEEENTD